MKNRYKKILLLLLLLLFVSIGVLYNNYQYRAAASTRSSDSDIIKYNDGEQENNYTNNSESENVETVLADNNINENNNRENNIIKNNADSISTLLGLPENYQSIIIKKNIFGLIDKEKSADSNNDISVSANDDSNNQDENSQATDNLSDENIESNPDPENKDENSIDVIEDTGINSEENPDYYEEQPEQYDDYYEEDDWNSMEMPLANPFYLLGVSINEDDRMAIIVSQNNNYKAYIIKPGQEIEGYLVKEIDYNEVIMEKDKQEIHVLFRE